MKTLLLLRHAKSSWNNPGLKDFDRPVLEAGVKRTKKIVRFLKEQDVRIDLIRSSAAARTMETATIVAEGLRYPVDKIWKEQALYEAGVEDYLDVIRDTPDEVGSLMLVGHNFTISHVANFFLGDVVEMLPTSGLVGITFKTDRWDEVRSATAKQLFVVFPKMLKG